jgi:hypothetical protein
MPQKGKPPFDRAALFRSQPSAERAYIADILRALAARFVVNSFDEPALFDRDTTSARRKRNSPHVFEALREIRNQVPDVLDANRYADQRIRLSNSSSSRVSTVALASPAWRRAAYYVIPRRWNTGTFTKSKTTAKTTDVWYDARLESAESFAAVIAAELRTARRLV